MRVEQSLLDVTEVRDDGRIRIALRGELDMSSARTLSERLRALLERHERILVDLDELDFIDMSGVRALLAAAAAAGDGGSFAVTEGSSPVRRLMGLVELEPPLPLDGRPA